MCGVRQTKCDMFSGFFSGGISIFSPVVVHCSEKLQEKVCSTNCKAVKDSLQRIYKLWSITY